MPKLRWAEREKDSDSIESIACSLPASLQPQTMAFIKAYYIFIHSLGKHDCVPNNHQHCCMNWGSNSIKEP